MRHTLRASVCSLAGLAFGVLATTTAGAQSALFDPVNPSVPVATEQLAVIRPLPAPTGGLMLRGEYDRLNLPVFMTSWEAANARALTVRIAERAVSSLPEAASLSILINGQPVSSLRGEDVAVERDITIPLTTGLLSPGFNAVTFVAENQHRVDCSTAGTYELWTRLDPAATGFAFQTQPVFEGGLSSLPSILERAGHVGAFRLVLSAGTDAATAGALIQIIQSVALAGWSWKPEVTIASTGSDKPGIEVRMISAADAGLLRSSGGSELLPGLWLIPSATIANRIDFAVVAASAPNLRDLAARLAREAEQRPSDGTAAGLVALGEHLIRPVNDRMTLTLADLGFESATFTGRRFADDVRITLPPDFFASGYGTVRMWLEGGYGAGLTRDSEMLVRVNGQVAVTVRFSDDNGDVFEQREISMPLTLFHPGVNAISFEAVSRTAEDLTCDPTRRISNAPRFAILDTTRIQFPSLARTGSLPELSSALTFGFPYTSSGDPLQVYVPGRDSNSLGVAATLAVRMAVNRGAPVPIDIRLAQPGATDRGGLVVAPRPSLPAWLADIAMPRPAPTGDGVGQQVAIGEPTAQTPTVPLANKPQAPINPFSMNTEAEPDSGTSWSEAIRTTLDPREWNLSDLGAVNYLSNLFKRTFGRPDPVRAAPLMEGDLLFAQAAALPPGTAPWEALVGVGIRPIAWTVVSAVDAASITKGMERFIENDNWDQAYGERMISRAGAARIETTVAQSQVLFATQDLTLGNARLTLAGWFSNKAGLYVAFVVVVTAFLGAIAYSLARMNGVKNGVQE